MIEQNLEDQIRERIESEGSLGTQGPQKQSQEVFDLFDVATAVPRGVGNALGEAYDLVDTITFDILPDTPDGRLFGESSSVAGGIVEGIAQFATGFIPVAGALSKASKFSKLGRAAKVFRPLSTAAERARRISKGSGRLVAAKRAAVAGVVTDFTVFDGHETRLSNLIQEHPSLANPVTEFLAADEGDGEIEGRLKSALEGLGLGFAVDGSIAGIRAAFSGDSAVAALKGVKAGRDAKAAGKSAKSIEEAAQEAYEKELTPDGTPRIIAEAARDVADDKTLTSSFGLNEESRDRAFKFAFSKAGEADDVRVNPRTLVDKDPLTAFHQNLAGDEINLENFPTHDGARLLRAIESEFFEGFGKTSPEALEELDAKALEMVVEVSSSDENVVLATLGADLADDLAGQAKLRARIHAVAYAQAMAGKKIRAAALKLQGPQASLVDEGELLSSLELLAETAQTTHFIKSETARTLRSIRGPVTTTPLSDLRSLIDSNGGSERIRKVAAKALETLESQGVAGLGKITNRYQKGLNITLEYWMNALLSGPKTQAVNGLSNFLVTMYRPFEKIAGGATGLLLGGGRGARDTLSVGLHELSGIYHGFRESLTLAGKSFKDNAPLLDPSFRKVDVSEGALKDVDVSSIPEKNRIAAALGTVMRFPTRMLATTDEFFKQVNFRSSLYSELHLKASKEGVEDIPSYIKTNFDNYIENGQALTLRDAYGRAVRTAQDSGLQKGTPEYNSFVQKLVNEDYDNGVAQRAIESAREATFTGELKKGTLGRGVQNIINQHPYLRFAMPFVRTPLNILNFAGQRLDAPGLAAALAASKSPKISAALANSNRRIIQDALSSDPRRKFEALGRLSLGFGAATYFLSQATNGSITGRGPTDTQHRKLLESTGWKPYSVLVGDTYVSYQRIDPFATIMGLAADIATYGQYADTDGQGDAEVLMGSLVAAMANNVTQKSYLTGMSNLIGVLEDPERNGARYLQQFTSSFIPNVLNQAEDVSDPHLREVRGMLDAITARIPGLSDNLPPRAQHPRREGD